MKFTNTHIIAFTLFAFIGIVNDILLSLNYYFKEPEFFIAYESNREFVALLTEGAIPIIMISGFVGLALICHVMIKANKSKSKHTKHLIISYAITMLFIFTLRTAGGLSWYIMHINYLSIIRLLQSYSLICLFVTASILVCIGIEERREKNAISNTDY